MTFHGTPPGFHAGDMSRRTVALRPDIGLAPELVEAVRRERKKGAEPPAIAETLAVPVEVVERAMLAMRTPKPDRRRRSLNCTLEACAFVDGEKQPGEPVWKAVDRLIGELIELRGAAGGLA